MLFSVKPLRNYITCLASCADYIWLCIRLVYRHFPRWRRFYFPLNHSISLYRLSSKAFSLSSENLDIILVGRVHSMLKMRHFIIKNRRATPKTKYWHCEVAWSPIGKHLSSFSTNISFTRFSWRRWDCQYTTESCVTTFLSPGEISVVGDLWPGTAYTVYEPVSTL